MKLIAFFLLAACMQVCAKGNAQLISVSGKNAPLEKIFKKIEKQTSYVFFYDEDALQQAKPVNIEVKSATLDEVLQQCFRDQPLRFNIVGETIVVSSTKKLSPEPGPEAAVALVLTEITGRVIDETGNPLTGASVKLKASTTGTMTDGSGHFTLQVPDKSGVLEISYVGLQTIELSLAKVTGPMNIVLKYSQVKADEVVVVGYGTQKRTSVTGAVASVNAKDIELTPTSSLSNLLAGRLPGAQVINNSGFVGASSDILVRGVGSGTGGTYPLVVIDNVVSTRADFDVLDPNEVATVTLLKDAATAAVYGSRASNGVILVTTRSGKTNQKALFSFKSYINSGSTTKPIQSFTATQELTYKNSQYKDLQELAGQPVTTLPYGADAFAYYKDKSYQLMDDLWRKPTSQQNDLSVSGGTDRLNYFMLVGFNDSKGSFNNTDYNRYNFRSKVEAKITDNLKIGLNISGNRRTLDRFYWPYDDEESTTLQDFYRATFNWTRLNPFYEKADGTPTNRLDPDGYPVIGGGWHPVELVYNGGYRKTVYNNFKGTLNIDLKIPFVEGLSTSVLGNYNTDTRNAKAFIKFNKSYFAQYQTAGSGLANYEPAPINFSQQNIHNLSSGTERINEAATFADSYQFNWFLNYARTFGKHEISANVIYEQSESNGKSFDGTAGRLLSSNVDQILAASSDAADRYFEGGEFKTARMSWIGRAHYEYESKYIGEFAFRRDASYIFAPGNRVGFFPSGSIAWRVSKEKFFDVPFVDEFKLRGSVGTTGNDGTADGSIAPFQWQNNYQIGSSYGFGTNYLVGLSPSVLPNPDITWEKATSYNGGLDFSLLKGKISGEFDYFTRKIYDILGSRIQTLPGTLGASLPAVNYAKKDVHGYEFSLQYRNKVGEVAYAIGANMGYARDKWVLVDEASTLTGTWRSRIGQPTDRLYGYISEGIIRDSKTVQGLIGSGFKQFGRDPMIGTILFKDIRGANFSDGPDGKIDENDATYLSNNAIPRINYGVNLSASWKGFKIDVLLQGVGAYDKIVSTMNTRTGGVFQVDRPYFNLWTDAWSAENPNGKYPKILDWGYEEAGYAPSSFWIRSGAYMRLRNLNISYSFPQQVIRKIGIKQLQLFFTGTNLFTISSFKEYDPEQPALDAYPIMKTISGGLNINF